MSEAKNLQRVAIIQSAYIPWKGFFDLIGRCDAYIIYDTAAFSKGKWHNRNRIKCPQGHGWLSIPVKTAGRLGQALEEVTVADTTWAEQHWSRLRAAYARTPFFGAESTAVRDLYEQLALEPRLSRINEGFIRWLTHRLALNTQIRRDREFAFEGDRTERLMELCKSVGATNYLSGPSARRYLEVEALERAGVLVEWMTYGPYPEYPQQHGQFDHHVSILDTLFCCGPESLRNMLLARSQVPSSTKPATGVAVEDSVRVYRGPD